MRREIPSLAEIQRLVRSVKGQLIATPLNEALDRLGDAPDVVDQAPEFADLGPLPTRADEFGPIEMTAELGVQIAHSVDRLVGMLNALDAKIMARLYWFEAEIRDRFDGVESRQLENNQSDLHDPDPY